MKQLILWILQQLEGAKVVRDGNGWSKYGVIKPSLEQAAKVTIAEAYHEFVVRYKRWSWIENPIKKLFMTDTEYNMGRTGALKCYQLYANLTVDGKLGPQTKAAINNMSWEQMIEARKNYYKILGKGSKSKYVKGWLSRVDNLQSKIKEASNG